MFYGGGDVGDRYPLRQRIQGNYSINSQRNKKKEPRPYAAGVLLSVERSSVSTYLISTIFFTPVYPSDTSLYV